MLSDTSTNGTWINHDKLLKNSKELRDCDKVKLFNEIEQATPPCAVFTFRLSHFNPSASAATADAGAGQSKTQAGDKHLQAGAKRFAPCTQHSEELCERERWAGYDSQKKNFENENVATGQKMEEEQEKKISGEAATGDGAFSSQLLADVLCAAFPTKVAMRDLVQAVKAKSEAFKSVQLSSKADGGAYSNVQIAERIAECNPDQVTNAEGLLSWLIKVRAVVTCA